MITIHKSTNGIPYYTVDQPDQSYVVIYKDEQYYINESRRMPICEAGECILDFKSDTLMYMTFDYFKKIDDEEVTNSNDDNNDNNDNNCNNEVINNCNNDSNSDSDDESVINLINKQTQLRETEEYQKRVLRFMTITINFTIIVLAISIAGILATY